MKRVSLKMQQCILSLLMAKIYVVQAIPVNFIRSYLLPLTNDETQVLGYDPAIEIFDYTENSKEVTVVLDSKPHAVQELYKLQRQKELSGGLSGAGAIAQYKITHNEEYLFEGLGQTDESPLQFLCLVLKKIAQLSHIEKINMYCLLPQTPTLIKQLCTVLCTQGETILSSCGIDDTVRQTMFKKIILSKTYIPTRPESMVSQIKNWFIKKCSHQRIEQGGASILWHDASRLKEHIRECLS